MNHLIYPTMPLVVWEAHCRLITRSIKDTPQHIQRDGSFQNLLMKWELIRNSQLWSYTHLKQLELPKQILILTIFDSNPSILCQMPPFPLLQWHTIVINSPIEFMYHHSWEFRNKYILSNFFCHVLYSTAIYKHQNYFISKLTHFMSLKKKNQTVAITKVVCKIQNLAWNGITQKIWNAPIYQLANSVL